MGFVAACQHG
ncbi:hypothetical protein YPPY02_1341, partial [Yersinia pestis PY-02]